VHTVGPDVYSVEPHPGFDPLTASDTDLACYGYELRPSDASALASWQARVGHLRYVVPTLDPRKIPNAGLKQTYTQSIWAGYGTTSSENGGVQWIEADMNWTQPYVPATADGRYLYIWPGLGGSGTPVIWQAGTAIESGPNGPQLVSFWYENYGCQSNPTYGCPNNGNLQLVSGISVHQGDQVHVRAKVSTGGTTGIAYFDNYTTGERTNTGVLGIDSYLTTTNANFIAEEPLCTSGCNYLPFIDPGINGATLYTTDTSYTQIDAYNYDKDVMNNYSYPSVIESNPGPINTSTHGFVVTCCQA